MVIVLDEKSIQYLGIALVLYLILMMVASIVGAIVCIRENTSAKILGAFDLLSGMCIMGVWDYLLRDSEYMERYISWAILGLSICLIVSGLFHTIYYMVSGDSYR